MSTALYRRYRPETFAEVIGQEHVTGPLSVALDRNRVSHAYLFSGPRGCGKTTSARILARCLNCAEGPTATPCGTCESCVALARGGSGSIDVIEIDAASHRGIDDAREIRDRAIFAPASSRYKIFIIDEAHMVTKEGFNALLKIVEEPPEHVKFVFATTEPDKVIGTIRSRTHHYPFRLVPPGPLQDYLSQLCTSEQVEVGAGVLPLVIRAGGGSVRDTLSVLDQLIAGAGPEGVTYDVAISLLGYTDASLLDDVVEALAAGDGATAFRMVEKVIDTGLDPRRFVEDLLERLRDLLVVASVRDGAHAVLRGVPSDQLDRMAAQAASFGAASLSRAADVCNAALTEMTGATSPRLHLELLIARLLLPAADDAQRGVPARLDRLERRIGMSDASALAAPGDAGGSPAVEGTASAVRAALGQRAAARGASAAAAPAAGAADERVRDESAAPAAPAPAPHDQADEPTPPTPGSQAAPAAPAAPASPATPAASAAQAVPAEDRPAARPATAPQVAAPQSPPPAPAASAPAEAVPPAPASPAPPAGGQVGGIDVVALRAAWPAILEVVRPMKRATWVLLTEHAQVLQFDGRHLVLGFSSPGLAARFSDPQHQDLLRQALSRHLGLDCTVSGVGGGAAAPAPAARRVGAGGPQGAGRGPGSMTSPTTTAPQAPAPAPAVDTSWPEVRPIPTGPVDEPSPARHDSAGSASVDAAGEAGSAREVGEAGEAPAGHPAAPSDRRGTDDRPAALGGRPTEATRPEHARPEQARPEQARPEQAPAAQAPAARAQAARAFAAPSVSASTPPAAAVPVAQPRQAGGRPPASAHDDIPLPDEPPPDDVPPAPEDWEPRERACAPASTPKPAAASASRPAHAPESRPAPRSLPTSSQSPATATQGQPSGAALVRAAARSHAAVMTAQAPDLSVVIDDEPSRDDVEVEGSGLVGAPVVAQLLGGKVIEERNE